MRELVRATEHDRQLSLGWVAVWWIEKFCVHGPGDVQGQPIELDDEFAAFVVDVYALDTTGRRLYDSAFLSRAKGRAKSELAGFIALFEAMGPARFSHFSDGTDVYERDGETYAYQPAHPAGKRRSPHRARKRQCHPRND